MVKATLSLYACMKLIDKHRICKQEKKQFQNRVMNASREVVSLGGHKLLWGPRQGSDGPRWLFSGGIVNTMRRVRSWGGGLKMGHRGRKACPRNRVGHLNCPQGQEKK